MNLENKLRHARIKGDTKEIIRIKTEMGILTRNMETITTVNKNGDILSVKQRTIEKVPCDKQQDTIETYISI